MNKNIMIGLLAIVVVVGGLYFLLRSNPDTTTTYENTPTTTDNGTTPPAVVDTTPQPSTPALTLSTPSVETNSNYSASSSTALVNGKVTPNGLSTSYWYEYGTTSSLGSKTSAQRIGSGWNAISAPAYISGLKSNTTYYYRLSASNSMGTTSGATNSLKTNTSPAPKAANPTALTGDASAITRTSATIGGQVNPNGWETNYWFEYGKDSNMNSVSSVKTISASSALMSANAVSEALSGLDPLTKYYFRLNAQNQFGTVNGAMHTFTTSGPASPSAPTVTTTSATSVQPKSADLNGRINPNGAETTYWFEYSQDSLLGNLIGSGTPTQTLTAGTNPTNVKANISGLNNDTKYYYHLVARNQYGTQNGSIMSFTTKK